MIYSQDRLVLHSWHFLSRSIKHWNGNVVISFLGRSNIRKHSENVTICWRSFPRLIKNWNGNVVVSFLGRSNVRKHSGNVTIFSTFDQTLKWQCCLFLSRSIKHQETRWKYYDGDILRWRSFPRFISVTYLMILLSCHGDFSGFWFGHFFTEVWLAWMMIQCNDVQENIGKK